MTEPSACCSQDIRAAARKVRQSGSPADNTGVRFSLSLLGRWLPVVALTAVGAAAAAGYAYTVADRYQATAQLIVSPVSSSDPTYLGLGLLRDTGGKRTAAASAAVMLRSPQVADAVRTELGLTRSRDSLLAALHAHAVGASDIVDVTVQDTSAVRAAQLANAFANALVSQRTASFQSQLTTAIRRAVAAAAGIAAGPAHDRLRRGPPAAADGAPLAPGPARSDHPPRRPGGGADGDDRPAAAADRRDRRGGGSRPRAHRGGGPRSDTAPAAGGGAGEGSRAALRGSGGRGADGGGGRPRAAGRREGGPAGAAHDGAGGARRGAGATHGGARDPHGRPCDRGRGARTGRTRGGRASRGRTRSG